MAEDTEENLPGPDTMTDWTKTIALFGGLVMVNVVAFLVSFGFGVIVTIPLTLFLAFLLVRNMVPKHRFPPGRRT